MLSRNQLSGPIPDCIGNADSLEWFRADENQLTGGIPSTITNLTALQHFNVRRNHLTGKCA